MSFPPPPPPPPPPGSGYNQQRQQHQQQQQQQQHYQQQQQQQQRQQHCQQQQQHYQPPPAHAQGTTMPPAPHRSFQGAPPHHAPPMPMPPQPPSQRVSPPPMHHAPPMPHPQQAHHPPPPMQPMPALHAYPPPPMQQQPTATGRSPPPIHGRPPPPQQQQQHYPPPELLTQKQYQQKKEFQQQQRQKIDPEQIPRPPLFTRPQQQNKTYKALPIYHPKATLFSETGPPPPADSRFVTQDDGNAAPQLIRSTTYSIPKDNSLLRKTGNFTMGLLCTPMAIIDAQNQTQHDDKTSTQRPRPRLLPNGQLEHWNDPMCIPLSLETTPPRCHQCMAYCSSFWDTHCNFCGATANPPGYCDKGTVEYTVDGPYITRSTGPVAPNYLYAIDATCPHLKDYIDMIRNVGVSLSGKARIGLVLVSTFGIYVPQFEKDGTICGFIVMADVTDEPYCPLPLEDWTFAVETQMQEWKYFMSSLWDTWQPFLLQLDCRTPYGTMGHAGSCGGAALAFLADGLALSGGRGTWLSWRRPNFGTGNIRDRERNNMKLYKLPEAEHQLYLPLQLRDNKKQLSGNDDEMDEAATTFYKNLAQKCAKNRVALDIMLHTLPRPVAFLDLATLGHVCRVTCGKLKWIKTSGDWKQQFQQELLRPVLSFHGTDAIFKVRCSNGLQVKRYLTTEAGVTVESLTGSPELELAVVGQDSCFAVELEHRVGGLPKKDKFAYVQSALLYTTVAGERRVRVSTLALKIGTIAAEVYRGIDFGTLAAFWTRQAIAHAWNPKEDNPLQLARKDLMDKTIKTLAAYRLNTAAWNEPRGQLMLPNRLLLLPLFSMALLKSSMLRSSLPVGGSLMRSDHANPNADERAYALFYGSSVNPAMAMLMVHPNIFSLSELGGGAGEWQIPPMNGTPQSEVLRAAHHPYVQLPKSVHPSIACIQDDQVYLVDDGMTIYIFVGQDVNRDFKSELLDATPRGCTVSTSSDLGQQVERLLWQMRTFSAVGPGAESMLRPTFAPVIVAQAHKSHADPFEEKVRNLMVDDQIAGEKDYSNFLVESHKLVREMVGKGSTD